MRFVWFFLPLLFLGCDNQNKQETEIPAHIPAPEYPAENPQTDAKIALGKRLFFERALSSDSSVSCASCHIPQYAFSDTAKTSLGHAGKRGFRNSPSLANVVFQKFFFWDAGVKTIERAVHPPMLADFEMNMDIVELTNRLESNASYVLDFNQTFGEKMEYKHVVHALAAYQRSLIFFNTPYDRFMAGDKNALNETQKRGLALFRSDTVGCAKCHKEPLFFDDTWHNIGLEEKFEDYGRGRVTLDSADFGKFKTPTLRNVAVTAPYMHNGSIATLQEVVFFYAGGGVFSPNKSALIHKINLNNQQQKDLIAFLEALTDDYFVLEKEKP